MLARARFSVSGDAAAVSATIIAAVGAATILGAWFFEYALKLAPCPLCLQQRWPYYVAVPVALVVALAAAREAPRAVPIGGLALLALIMLGGAALGVYHAGAEWKWWDGPQDCAGSGFSGGAASDLLRRMQTARVVRCDEAAWRDPVLSLSLAGWNVLISLALAAVSIGGMAAAMRRTNYGSSSVSQ